MKTKITICILLFGVFVNAQIRVQYELNYIMDSTTNYVEQEVFNLDIEQNKSLFYPTALASMDSLVNADNYLYNNNVVEPKLDYMIEKNNDELFFDEAIALNIFHIKEPRILKWEIIPNSIDSIEQFKVQKAETRFGGRKWIAYYTSEIPYSEGPYKFKGLPGLILKVHDQNKDYIFDLIAIKQIKEIFEFTFHEKIGVRKVDMDFLEYKKFLSEIETNPKVIAYLMTGNYNVELPTELSQQFVERYKKEKIKKNNPIELSLDE
ncbi:GLPGLI family protein [Weeksellaceae bacterium KMM 9724]|uniref:GLPGLI family protein n=1 Tax=Profundicola chukchiensis TaxID=2961959 RepID=UPI00243BFBD5|nr:GLPGLI family protein [Profundicola chukchiensis]MDG4950461.1 GLPGLI family protein [Profundicola chukchiensis]